MNVRHLARLAQLSPSAVSLALRGSPKISAATRERVQMLAQKNGYVPDAKIVSMMRSLRQPKSQRQSACFGVISLYAEERPWHRTRHLKRIYDGMDQRAQELGYRLEPIWLRAPGMTYRRFCSILDARGIEGLLCFGSPDLHDDFPGELDHYAIVTQGMSIRTRLHRVTSHFYNDTVHVLNRMQQLGYRRLGLIISHYEDMRSSHAHISAYLGWHDRSYGFNRAIPPLCMEEVEEKPLMDWWTAYRPDGVVFVHNSDTLREFQRILKRNRLQAPDDLGVAVLSHILEGTGWSGLQQNAPVMGAWAVELLAARIANRDFGFPKYPRIEMVESEWVEGTSLTNVNS
jgi:LacI family transcriptional regulator